MSVVRKTMQWIDVIESVILIYILISTICFVAGFITSTQCQYKEQTEFFPVYELGCWVGEWTK